MKRLLAIILVCFLLHNFYISPQPRSILELLGDAVRAIPKILNYKPVIDSSTVKLNVIHSPIIKQQNVGCSVTVDKVRVRDCPALDCAISGMLNRGEVVEVIDSTSVFHIEGLGGYRWYEITSQHYKGFVFGSFIQCGTTTNKQNNKVQSNAQILGDKVNLRTSPDLKSQVVKVLNLGEQVNVLKKSNVATIGHLRDNWYYIQHTSSSKRGYVFGHYISKPRAARSNYKVFVLSVGIGDYSPAMNANGVKDLSSADGAKSIFRFYKSANGGNVPDSQVKLLRDKTASASNIIKQASRLFGQASKNDVVIFYFSGHGGNGQLCTYDANISYDDIANVIEKCKAKRKIWITDACHSGSANNSQKIVPNISKVNNQNEAEQAFYDALKNDYTDITFISSSLENQYSWATGQFGMGVFTHFWLEGLNGKADRNKNQIVDLDELFSYTSKRVSDYTTTKIQQLQTPWIGGLVDHNMPMGIVF